MTGPWQERAAKGHRRGTHRLVAPGATFERVAPLRARMGITRIANVTGLDRIGIPVVMVCRPNSRSIAVSQGKGLDLDAARASGLMELVENYHAERIDLPLRLATLQSLQERHPTVDVDALPRVTHGRFGPNLRLLWIEGQDLGAVQGQVGQLENRLSYAINLAQSQIVNTRAAESRIRDANIAEESANLTRFNILNQSGIAALAQANQSTSAVLSLLR